MKGLTIIEHDDGRLVLAYTPANPSTDDLVRLLHSAMSMVISADLHKSAESEHGG